MRPPFLVVSELPVDTKLSVPIPNAFKAESSAKEQGEATTVKKEEGSSKEKLWTGEEGEEPKDWKKVGKSRGAVDSSRSCTDLKTGKRRTWIRPEKDKEYMIRLEWTVGEEYTNPEDVFSKADWVQFTVHRLNSEAMGARKRRAEANKEKEADKVVVVVDGEEASEGKAVRKEKKRIKDKNSKDTKKGRGKKAAAGAEGDDEEEEKEEKESKDGTGLKEINKGLWETNSKLEKEKKKLQSALEKEQKMKDNAIATAATVTEQMKAMKEKVEQFEELKRRNDVLIAEQARLAKELEKQHVLAQQVIELRVRAEGAEARAADEKERYKELLNLSLTHKPQ